ncbi:sca1 complex scaffold protein scaa [Anaeramoeba flamelloides]|uniref:Sca1 complex scaffold protein scaa n=1 Tax=Anaeramoeba flamelloides TaxID=1746091 RepID=A0ABQ8XNU5_9EUKA|nr:sca1 complex scaffold protein scaa [Anaeramoeba flamelloides]
MSKLKTEIKTPLEKKDKKKKKGQPKHKKKKSKSTIEESENTTLEPQEQEVEEIERLVDGIRQFLGIGGAYRGSVLKEKEISTTRNEKKQTLKTPVFLDGEGNVYDINYLPIQEERMYIRNEEQTTEQEQEIDEDEDDFDRKYFKSKKDVWEIQKEALLKHAPKNLKKPPKFPDPEDFETYMEFEEASIKWHNDMEGHLGILRLPNTVGQSYSRPKEIEFFSKMHNLLTIDDVTETSFTDMDTVTEPDSQSEVTDLGSDDDDDGDGDGDDDEIEKEPQGVESLPNLPDPESLDELPNPEDLPDLPDLEDLPDLDNLNSLPDLDNLEDLPEPENLEDLPEMLPEMLPEPEDLEILPDLENNSELTKTVEQSEISEKTEISESQKTNETTKNESEDGITKATETEVSEFSEKSEKSIEQSQKTLENDQTETQTDVFNLEPNQEYQLLRALDKGFESVNEKSLSFDFSKAISDKESWDNLLIPSEPLPEYYRSIGEYIRAYQRWVQIILKTLPIIPLHPSQFEDQINLKPIKIVEQLKEFKMKPIYMHTFEKWCRKLVLNNAISIFKLGKIQINTLEPEISSLGLTNNLWEVLTEKKKELIFKSITKMHQKLKMCNQLFKSNVSPIVGKYHGVYTGHGSKSEGANKNSSSALLRKKLDSAITYKRYNCENVVGKKTVDFSIPEYDLREPIDFKKINEENELNKQKMEVEILNHTRNKETNSWWYPGLTLEKFKDKVVKKMNHNLPKPKKLKIKHIIAAIQTNQFADSFKDFINSKYQISEEKTSSKTVLQLFLKTIQPKNFRRILNIYHDSKSQIIHSKVTTLVEIVMQSDKAADFVQHFLQKNDFKSLSYLVYGLCYNNKLISNIYWYNEELIDLVKLESDDNQAGLDFIHTMYLSHYLSLLNKALKLKRYKIKETLPQLLKKESQKIYVNVINLFNEHPKLLENFIFHGIGNRSSKYSGFFLFLFIQLLNIEGSQLDMALFSKEVDLVFRLRRLSQSRYSHAQYAAKIIWNKMKELKFINSFGVNYAGASQNILDDLFANLNTKMENYQEIIDNENEEGNKEEINEEKKKKNLIQKKNLIPAQAKIPELTNDLCSYIYKNLPKNLEFIDHKRTVLFSENLFREILGKLSQQTADWYPSMLNNVGYFIRSFVESLTSLGCLVSITSLTQQSSKQSKKSKKASKNGNQAKEDEIPRILLTKQDILAFFEILQKTKKENYEFKSSIITSLRTILKKRDFFPLISDKLDIFNKLQELLFDDENMAFNRNVWRCLFQIFKYHEGFVEFLVNNNCLETMVEFFIGGGKTHQSKNEKKRSVFGISHGIYYFYKLLDLINVETSNLQSNLPSFRPYSKDSIKSLKKDIEFITDIFVKNNLYIKYHMQFKKFDNSFSGLPYLAVSGTYYLISSSPHCSKILKDFKKTKVYYQAIQKIKTIYTSENKK